MFDEVRERPGAASKHAAVEFHSLRKGLVNADGEPW